jgi:D-psicose/D-tagatose/L-ribulose 3-epimerase
VRLAISNLAWPAAADGEVAFLLPSYGVEGVELAPTRVWPAPDQVSRSEIRACRSFWESAGLEIVAFQALLFGKPELSVFGTPAVRRRAADYLRKIIALAGQLGARALVFGSPKNRQRGELTWEEALTVAVPFFRALGEEAQGWGVCLCIEPNPVEYGCDFVTCIDEGIALVDAVAHPGFGLHLDTGGMKLAQESPARGIARAGQRSRHFHVSTPYLKAIEPDPLHAECARALRQVGYQGWVSIEMVEGKLPAPSRWRQALGTSLEYVHATYAVSPRVAKSQRRSA